MTGSACSRRGSLALVGALTFVVAAPVANAAEAFFPGVPPATQVTRDLTLSEAAQRGLVTLEAKGGDVGDVVSLELKHKKVRGPISVTLRVEFTVKTRVPAERRAAFAETLAEQRELTQTEMNRLNARTRAGDPIRFTLDWRFRNPEESPRANFHQVEVINPYVDLVPPDPGYRSGLEQTGTPNGTEPVAGTFSTADFNPAILSHESLHIAGLDDRYFDYYRVGGSDYPLPQRGFNREQQATFARAHTPRLPAPPAGRLVVKNTPGVSPCDVMGVGAESACRRMSPADADWFDSHAAVQVTAEPGDLLLNKDPERQNFGVGFRSVVFATPGSTTRANGISVYCIDKNRFLPLSGTFDAAGPARDLPGYDALAALLDLSGRIQPSLDEVPAGMLNAVWNVTDASPLDTSGSAEESRALLAQAGIAENSVPGGLDNLPNPNAGSAASGAVAGGTPLPVIDSPVTSAPAPRLTYAQITPTRLAGRRNGRVDLLVSAIGDVSTAELTLERRAGRRWITARALGERVIDSGDTVTSLAFGRLSTGRYRLAVVVAAADGTSVVRRLPLTVTR